MGHIILSDELTSDTPSTGYTDLYIKSDKNLYKKDENGNEYLISLNLIKTTISIDSFTIDTSTQMNYNKTITGVSLGDHILISCNENLNGILLSAQASVTNTILISFLNMTGSNQSITTNTYNIIVIKK